MREREKVGERERDRESERERERERERKREGQCVYGCGAPARITKCQGWSRTASEFFIDNLMVRIQLIIVMILVDRPCAMGV